MLMLLAVGVLAVPAMAQTEYRPAGGGFRVEYPGRPIQKKEISSTRFGPTPMESAEWIRPKGGSCYANHTLYPPQAGSEDPQRLLDQIRVGRTVKGTLRIQNRFQYDGNPAQRDVVDWHVGTRPVIVSLDVIRGTHLYSVFCIVERGQETATDVTSFVDSFALLPF
jgi:hypothetical protein